MDSGSLATSTRREMVRGWGVQWGGGQWSLALTLACGLGDVQFSVASDDNSEFWLSLDESPAAAQLVAFVGKVPLPGPGPPLPRCPQRTYTPQPCSLTPRLAPSGQRLENSPSSAPRCPSPDGE